ncbi:MAG: archease [Thermoanaerobaculia bacterium]|jgi:SHS2 domain-containing protein
MAYRFIEHTADMGVEIEGASFESLLSEGLLALTDTLTEVERLNLELELPIDLIAPSREDLLVEWLSEIVYLFETKSVLLRQTDLEVEAEGGGWRLRGTVRGERYDPDRHEIKTLIKAVTYHQLRVKSSTTGWSARVIFDL